jgi:hypothetical protein
MPHYHPMIDQDAYILREATGTSGVLAAAYLAGGSSDSDENAGRTSG